MNNNAIKNIAAPATLLTVAPTMTGVGVAASVSELPDPLPAADVLDDTAPETRGVTPETPVMNAPASVDVDVASKERLGE